MRNQDKDHSTAVVKIKQIKSIFIDTSDASFFYEKRIAPWITWRPYSVKWIKNSGKIEEAKVSIFWYREGKDCCRRPKQHDFEYCGLFLHAALQVSPLRILLLSKSILCSVSGPKRAWWGSAQSDLLTGCWLLLLVSTSVTENTLHSSLKLFFHGRDCSCSLINNYMHVINNYIHELEGNTGHKDQGASVCERQSAWSVCPALTWDHARLLSHKLSSGCGSFSSVEGRT